MAWRSVGRFVVACGLTLGVSACGDNDARPEAAEDGGRDGGGDEEDSGTRADGGQQQDGGGSSVKCGANTCNGTTLISTPVGACCVPDEDGNATTACGLKADDIKKANPTSPFTGCVPKDVPYASLSTYCGEFFDQVEPDGDHTNGGLDIKGTLPLVFEGCCLPSGECGANIRTPRNIDPEVLDSHLGCVSYTRLAVALSTPDGGAPPLPAKLPFCVPETGEPPTSGTVPSAPRFDCGCGVGVVDDHSGLPCLNNLPPEVCGADAPTDEQLAMIPEFICGCTADSKLPCLKNTSASACGTKPIDADSDELAQVPVFICGALGGQPTVLPTLPNVESSVCGTKAIDADSDELDQVPAFICGAVGNPETHLPVLRNVEAAVCGKQAITAGSEFLADVPALICGGCEGAAAGNGYPCLPNVDPNVCGRSFTTIPTFVEGCGVTTPLGSIERLCIPFQDPSVHGQKDTSVDETNHCLSDIPEYAVGCGDLSPSAQNPCLPDLPPYFGCDQAPDAPVRGVPQFVCGCGDGVPYLPTTRAFPCISNVPKEICGALPASDATLAAVPEYVCGCGADKYYEGVGTPCLARQDAGVCGHMDTQIGSRDFGATTAPCLVGVPEYIQGCGDGPNGVPSGASDICLPHAGAPIIDPQNPPPRLFGCTNVTAPPPNVFEYICGCGEATAYPGGIPCLSFVDAGICGMIQISTAAALLPTLQNVSMTYCGCGDGQMNDQSDSLDCLQNIPLDVCAPAPPSISLGADGPEDDCVLGFPQEAFGCGAGTTASRYPIECIPNVAETLPGCPTI